MFSYFIRYLIIKFYLMQTAAEKTRDSLIKIFDSMPDGVIILEEQATPLGMPNFTLHYCNKQADEFFGTKLSELFSA